MVEALRVVLLIKTTAAIQDKTMALAAEPTQQRRLRMEEVPADLRDTVPVEVTNPMLLRINQDTIRNKAVIHRSNHQAHLSSKGTGERGRMDRRLQAIRPPRRLPLDGRQPPLLTGRRTITTNQRAPHNGTSLPVLRKQRVRVCSRARVVHRCCFARWNCVREPVLFVELLFVFHS